MLEPEERGIHSKNTSSGYNTFIIPELYCSCAVLHSRYTRLGTAHQEFIMDGGIA